MLALASLSTAASCAGCDPHVKRFDATPPFICAGQTTRLSWETDGNATLAAAPPIETLGPVTPSESRDISIAATTTFTLTATKGAKSDSARRSVTVVDAREPQRVQLEQKACDNGASVYDTDIPSEKWPAIVHMGNVKLQSPLAFDLVVEHGGKTATLEKGKTNTAAFGGTPFAGHFRAVLKTASCDDALNAIVLPTSVSCSQ